MRLIYLLFRLVFCLLIALVVIKDDCYAQSEGLAFSSYEALQDKRTGLDLAPDPICFSDNFEISFDFSFLPNHEPYFGYILRIIEDDERNIDLINSTVRNQKHFNLIVGNQLTKIGFDIAPNKLYHQWNHIRIRFNFDQDKITLYNGQASFTVSGLHLKKGSCYKFLFGVNHYKQFWTTNVPSMKLKDICITQNAKVKYDWPLNEAIDTIAHDIIGQKDAAILNPVWIAAMHSKWEPAKNLIVKGEASVAFNPQKEEIYVVTSDSLYTYNIGKMKWVSTAYSVGGFELYKENQSFYNSLDGKLYNLMPDQLVVPKYDFSDRKWDKQFNKVPLKQVTPHYWQFNKLFSHADTSYYVFCGYGFTFYSNKVRQYHLNTGFWNDIKVNGDFFMPRYLAALGSTTKGDTAYILGGYGSNTGQQIISPQNTYDMVRFTSKDKTFKKLFDLKANGKDFAFANSLVIDDKKNYYGLIYPTDKFNSTLQLIKGSLNGPSYEYVSNTIPYSFQDTHSFADLYYCPGSKQFIAVTLSKSDNDNQTTIHIYTLLGPPIALSNGPVSIKNNRLWYYTCLILSFIVMGIYLFQKKRKQTPATMSPAQILAESLPIRHDEQILALASGGTAISENNKIKNSILLFGIFRCLIMRGMIS
jgi:hypothetical protein